MASRHGPPLTPVPVGRRVPRSDRAIEALTVLLVFGAVTALTLPAWLMLAYRPDHGHPVNRLLDACQEGARRGSLALVGFAAAFIIMGWAGTFLARVFWLTGRDLRAMRRLSRQLAAAPRSNVTVAHRSEVVAILPDRVAFTAGLLRPRVYLGTELVRALDPDETEAVLLHEMQHRKLWDPLRCWLVELVLGSVMWRPAGRLSAHYRACREAAADWAAVRAQGDDRPLLRALAKTDGAVPVAGACGLSSERAASLRQLRYCGLGPARSAWCSTMVGLALMVTLLAVAVAGLMDWQLYWFCPYGTMTS